MFFILYFLKEVKSSYTLIYYHGYKINLMQRLPRGT